MTETQLDSLGTYRIAGFGSALGLLTPEESQTLCLEEEWVATIDEAKLS